MLNTSVISGSLLMCQKIITRMSMMMTMPKRQVGNSNRNAAMACVHLLCFRIRTEAEMEIIAASRYPPKNPSGAAKMKFCWFMLFIVPGAESRPSLERKTTENARCRKAMISPGTNEKALITAEIFRKRLLSFISLFSECIVG